MTRPGLLASQSSPPALTVEELVAASGGFRKGTSAVDGLHPRQVWLLTEGALMCLSRLFSAYEAQAERVPSLAAA